MGYLYEAMKRAVGDDGRQVGLQTPAPRPSEGEVQPQLQLHAPTEPRPGRESVGADADPLEAQEATQAPAEDARHVSTVPADIDDRLVALTNTSSLMSEEYRAIRTSLLARWEHRRHLIHTLTSATPQEGKTITSLNLGLSFSELRNRRTLVVEADLRLPQFAKLFNLDSGPGLVQVIEGSAKLDEATVEIGETNLHVIPAGVRANDRAVQLLHSPAMASLLRQLRQKYDHVIIDTPPVVELADAGIIGSMSDDVLLIVRMGRTPQPLVEQAVRTLTSYNASVAGLIATDERRHRGRYYYKYGYRYRYRYTERKAA